MMSRIFSITLALILVLSLTFIKKYLTWEYGGQVELFWNAKEAWLFINTNRNGWHGNYLQWLAQVGVNMLGLPTRGIEAAPTLTVFRLTAGRAERRDIPNAQVGAFWVFGDEIYGGYSAGAHRGSFAKWTGTTFEPVSAEQRDSVFAGSIPCDRPGCEFTNAHGWSHRCCLFKRGIGPQTYPTTSHGAPVLTVTVDGAREVGWMDVRWADGHSERIWSVDEHRRNQSAADYASFLRR